MPSIAIAVRPAGLTVLPCRFVTVAGETFALHREIAQAHWGAEVIRPPMSTGKRWTVSDPETGTHIGHGATQAEAVAAAPDAAEAGRRAMLQGRINDARGALWSINLTDRRRAELLRDLNRWEGELTAPPPPPPPPPRKP